MQDMSFSFSVYTLAAGICWSGVVGFMSYGITTDQFEACAVALALSALAATLSIRCFCQQLSQNMQAAFDLGHDAGASEIRRLERV